MTKAALFYFFQMLLLASCRTSEGFIPTSRTCRADSSSVLHQSRTSNENDEANNERQNNPQDVGRRKLMISLAPLILFPSEGAFSVETAEVSTLPNFECLLDLPPLEKDYVRIYMCRHGQTENNRLRKVQGARVDPPINSNGIQQAENLGKALANANPRPERFFCSYLERAKMTAETAASQIDRKITPQPVRSVGEVDFGPVAEGQPVALAKAGMQATYASWAIGSIDYRPQGGGESGRDVLLRAAESLQYLAEEAKKSKGGCVAVVTHSTFLRILIGMVADEPLLESASRQVVNGSVTVIDVRKDMARRTFEAKPKLLGGAFSQVPADFSLEIPICKLVVSNESRHLPILA